MIDKKSIGLVTCEKYKYLFPAESKLPEYIENEGAKATPLVWNDATIKWKDFDLLVLRSTWDYFLHLPEFLDWLRDIEKQGIHIVNPVPDILANIHKSYLADLADEGFDIPQTVFLNKGSGPVQLANLVRQQGWMEFILKPAVSALSHNTYRMGLEELEEGQAQLDKMLREQDVLIQEFCPEILAPGEWSLIFLNGVYSHSVLKTPKSGDFRTQQAHGGMLSQDSPALATIDIAQKLVSKVYPHLLYTRVDGVERNGKFLIMEVELIEPRLFLELSPGKLQHFAKLLVGRAYSSSGSHL